MILLSFPFTWLYRAAVGSVVLASLLHGGISWGDGLSGPQMVPDGSPLIVGSGASLAGAGLLLLVVVVYAVLGRDPRTTDGEPPIT